MYVIDVTPTYAVPIAEYGSRGARVAGADGTRCPMRAGQGAVIARGEVHAKGSEAGCSAVMIQLGELAPAGELIR